MVKLSDLNNPAAAAAVIKDFQARFSTKVCLYPKGGCGGGIIAAHTLSAEGVLRPISRDGHVYAMKTNLYAPAENGPTTIGLLGIRNTSVFNGFCATHDKALFSPIEDIPFACTPQQLFTHAYRAVAKESYLKRKQAESPYPDLETFRSIHGLPNELELALSDEALLAQASSLRGAEEIERTKALMDEYLSASDWRRVMTTVIPFKKPPTVVCNFIYAPDHDFDGSYLQQYEDWETDLSHLMVTIIPAHTGGYALLSHLDTANAAPRRMIESLMAEKDLTSSLLWLVFCHTENFAISPVWYEALTEHQSKAIMDGFLSNVDLFDSRCNQLRERKLSVDSWEPGKPFNM
jgi:hypothetical protein